MALVLKHLRSKQLVGAERAQSERKLKKWLVTAALSTRYGEGVHNKQVRDKDDMILWLDGGDDQEPEWIREFRIVRLTSDTPDGAVGRLLRCLINERKPKDPVTHRDVGERPTAVLSAKHHIFPTRWVDKYLPGWDVKRDRSDLALNVTTISQETNIRWINVDPANQIQEIRQAASSDSSMFDLLRSHFLDEECLKILSRPGKSHADFDEFLAAREHLFTKALLDEFGIQTAGADGSSGSPEVSSGQQGAGGLAKPN